MVKDHILGTIGSTPMVRINRLCPNPKVNIFAKLEGFNPTGSFFNDDIGRMLNMKKKLADKLKSVLSISADVRLMEPGSIERSQGKGKHVIDNRKLK